MNFKSVIKFLLFFITISIYGQPEYQITGVISDHNNKGIAYVNVLLIKATDSTLVKGTITSETGAYKIDNVVTNDSYIIMCSYVGYQTKYSIPFNLNKNYTVENLILSEGENLDEVYIEAKKPLYVQKADRMVIHVENSIVSSGSTALEVLERSPGINVNRHSNSISIAGKEGVVVMINNKISYMPASALVQMLDGMSADNISSIELITTPPANFDAEGNAGFINIILKERTDLGLNGSYTLSAGLGGKGSITSNNINFNYRKEKLNLFGNYSYSNRTQFQSFEIIRNQEKDNDLFSSYTLTSRDPKLPVHTGRLGLDYQVTNKTIMGVLLNATTSRFTMDAITDNILSENSIETESSNLILNELNHWKDFGANFNIKHNFTEKQFINFDLIYLYFKDNNPIDYENTYYDGNQNFSHNESVRSRKLTPIKRWIGNVDYNNTLNDKLKLEIGIKGAFSTFDNNVSVEYLAQNNWVIDPTLSSKSDLTENIYAAYAAMEYKLNDNWVTKIGMRYEHTNSQLNTDTGGRLVDRQYGKFFPTVFLNRKFSDYLNMNFSYTKRITRPTFNEMAPFTIMWDPNTFTVGNVDLQPAIANSIKYDINYKSYIVSLQYTHEDASINNWQLTYDNANDRILLKAENADNTKTFSATFGFPLKISDWWRIQNNFIYINQSFSGYDSNDAVFNIKSNNFNLNSISAFKLSDTFSCELTALYTGPRYAGTSKFKDFYKIDIGLQQDLGKKWGKLRFSITDVFNSYLWNGTTNIPEQNMNIISNFKWIHTTYSLTYSRNFGNSKLKSSRKREGNIEKERRRVN